MTPRTTESLDQATNLIATESAAADGETAAASVVFQVQLPLTRLNVLRVGAGEPVLIVPATISLLDDWRPLAEFIGQYFETYFFELPGHGQSTPFAEPYCSNLTAATIEMLLDELGLDQITILGFSFGGILTMKTLYKIRSRIKAVVLLAPCIGPESLRHSRRQQRLIRMVAAFLNRQRVQAGFMDLVHHNTAGRALTKLVMRLGHLEGTSAQLHQKVRQISRSTLDVLSYQVLEILSIQFPRPVQPFSQPCYFGMSVHDPLLDFDRVHDFLAHNFAELHTMRFDHPYHQPPYQLSVADYNREYGALLAEIAASFDQERRSAPPWSVELPPQRRPQARMVSIAASSSSLNARPLSASTASSM